MGGGSPHPGGLGLRSGAAHEAVGTPAQPRTPSLRSKGRAAKPPVQMPGSALSPSFPGRDLGAEGAWGSPPSPGTRVTPTAQGWAGALSGHH